MIKNQKISKLENVLEKIQTPTYVCEEELLEENLKRLSYVKEQSGVKILLALKGFALQDSFYLVSKYLDGCCASGLYEAKFAYEKFKKEVHTYSPAFKDEDIDEILEISHHVVFNSFSQWKKFRQKALNKKVSCGLRINPEVSSSPVEMYDPSGKFSRLGITKANFEENEIDGIEGLHFHALCEQNVDALERVLKGFEEKFSVFIPKMKWINFGGGHHITREDYDIDRLVCVIKEFKKRCNNVEVYLEPGEAVGWQSGSLVASVLDVVENGMKIAILDTSAEAHMPDTILMPYRANVRYSGLPNEKKYRYRLAGNTCLAGDIIGDYSFDEPLCVGQKIIFEDMMHYTIVKNTTFNGIKLPDIAMLKKDGSYKVLKHFGYKEYERRN
ncbi:MAG: carboxynorspermidine decarboxylase [Campylobacteraceae bacterium]|jgi:carboxynorspermidine decarboxylase|nr:carboxynorspermidine decarboxylase [Campylobacteraceae bacterium]